MEDFHINKQSALGRGCCVPHETTRGHSCWKHDEAYRSGVNKNEADSRFLSDMFQDVADSGNPLYYPVAVLYYVAVVIFGGIQYPSGSSDDSDQAFANVG